jgi:hypothetical protein
MHAWGAMLTRMIVVAGAAVGTAMCVKGPLPPACWSSQALYCAALVQVLTAAVPPACSQVQRLPAAHTVPRCHPPASAC